MKAIRRLIYLFYYIKETNFRQLSSFIKYSTSFKGKSRASILADAVCSVFKYNISLKDYFCFRFYLLRGSEREKWAGTGYMYEYQLRMNPKGARDLLEDKIKFLNHFRAFIKREYASLSKLKSNQQITERMLANSSGRMVLKGSHGQVGAEVEVIQCNIYTPLTLIKYMEGMKFDLAEEYVMQHPSLMALSPSGLNTIRVFTQYNKGQVDILGARLRVSVNSSVDNMAAGNLAAPVDLETGVINGPGVYSDITKKDETIHPITGKSITGFAVPHWKDVIELAIAAALLTTENKSIGWDIAVTEIGPELIEGNHNWCKLLWQLPVKQGLKRELIKYL
jgi:hypothetical protein